MPAAAIAIDSLTKVYAASRGVRDIVLHPLRPPDRILALDRLTLDIEPGEAFGLLGPNGAGKTTLLKLLACLILPTSGEARVNGHPILGQEHRVKSSIGYVTSDERSFYWRLTGRENLRFFAHLYGLSGEFLKRRCAELLEKVELDSEAVDERFMNYSSGMRQRLAIARALLHDPPILFMDEPTRSLDPLSARHLRAFMREVLVRMDGKTVLLATHNLREAEDLCTRIGILVRARLRRVGRLDDLRRWAGGGGAFRVEVEGIEAAALPEGCRLVERRGARRLKVAIDDGGRLDDTLRRLHVAGARVDACERAEASLEEVFDRICGETASADDE